MLKNTSPTCREDGFTLIELLIVIVIIGILAAIAIPVFLSQAQSARNASVDSDTRNAASKVAQEVAVKGFPTVAADITALEAKLTKSNGNQLKLASAANGNYTVTGWNDDTEKYTVVFTSADGKFSKDTTTAEATSTNGAAGGTTTPAAVPVNLTWNFETTDSSNSWNGITGVTNVQKHGGTRSGTVTISANGGKEINQVVSGLTTGVEYTFKGWVYTADPSFSVSISTPGGTTSTISSFTRNGWTEVTHKFTATSTSTTLKLIGSNGFSSGTYQVDDFSLVG